MDTCFFQWKIGEGVSYSAGNFFAGISGLKKFNDASGMRACIHVVTETVIDSHEQINIGMH